MELFKSFALTVLILACVIGLYFLLTLVPLDILLWILAGLGFVMLVLFVHCVRFDL